MTNPLKNPLIRYGIIFSLIPVLVSYGLGHALNIAFADTLQSNANLDANDPERMNLPKLKYIFPLACVSGIVAFTVWLLLMKKAPNHWKGVIAGIVTVFLCYPILGFLAGLTAPTETSILFSGIMGATAFILFGNILTFWITYPLGAVCGFLIADNMMKKNYSGYASVYF